MEIRYGRYVFRLGPLTSFVVDRAKWFGQDGWPGWQCYADEVERLLSFAEARGVFATYRTELCGTCSQRDSAIAELRTAYFLDRNQFRVTQWRPVGEGTREGEFVVVGPNDEEIFVEVKSPGWEGELSPEEIRSGRAREDKYQSGEGRNISNERAIAYAVDKAYPKFSNARRNLLVIVDDLFVSLEHATHIWARPALYNRRALIGTIPPGKFATPAYERLGGAGLLWHKTRDHEVWYEMKLFLNPFAKVTCALPPAFIWSFSGTIM